MIDALKAAALQHGDRLAVVPVSRLKDLQDGIARFQQEQELNGFQKWIVERLYSYDIPPATYALRSIVIVAVPHPAYAEVVFTCRGREYRVYGLVASQLDQAESYLAALLGGTGLHLVPAPSLPLKRLAVQSALAKYGRNNITYVPGMGSQLSYVAFFSDMECQHDPWREVQVAPLCQKCTVCVHACPTGAIRRDRFLLDNSRCLSAMNESAADFPEWLSPAVHHTIYDCLRCQIACPMNQAVNRMASSPVWFSEEETGCILDGVPYTDMSASFRRKVALLDLEKWAEGIPRNLRLLFDLMDRGHIPSLK